MRKYLIVVLILLLLVAAYLAIFDGLQIGDIQILSVEQIIAEDEKLSLEIATTQQLMSGEYITKTEALEASVSNLLVARDEYLDLASISTESELSKANTDEFYTVEFLWTRLGRYSTKEGVNLNYTISSGGAEGLSDISFTVSGNYIPIINFINDIEDDDKLGFRIENFKMLPNESEDSEDSEDSDEKRIATFVTRNVSVKLDNVQDNYIDPVEENDTAKNTEETTS